MVPLHQLLKDVPRICRVARRTVMQVKTDIEVEQLISQFVDGNRGLGSKKIDGLRDDNANGSRYLASTPLIVNNGSIDVAASTGNRLDGLFLSKDSQSGAAGVAADMQSPADFTLAWYPFRPNSVQDFHTQQIRNLDDEGGTFEYQGHEKF